jgi:hypothetical protein
VVIRFHDAGDAFDLSEEEVPEAEDEGGARHDQQHIGDDHLVWGLVAHSNRGEDGVSQQGPAGEGRQHGDGEHDAGEASAAAALADHWLGEADIVAILFYGRTHAFPDTVRQ